MIGYLLGTVAYNALLCAPEIATGAVTVLDSASKLSAGVANISTFADEARSTVAECHAAAAGVREVAALVASHLRPGADDTQPATPSR